MKKKIIALIMIIVSCFTVMLLPACFDDTDSGETTSSGNTVTNKKVSIVSTSDMKVSHSPYLGYSVEISGVAKNTTSKTLSYISITYAIYDADGVQLGTAMDNVNDVTAGTSWKFKASSLGFFDEKPVSFKLTEITAF